MTTVTGKAFQIYLPLAGVCAVVLGLAHVSVASVIDLWGLSNYEHAWLVPLISLYLLWLGRASLNGIAPEPDLGAGLLFLGAVWVWVVARLTSIQAAEHVALWAMLNAATWTALGWPVYRRLMIPLLFLFLALPIGTSLVPVLMESTARIAEFLLNVFGIPAYREGMFFTLPGGRFVVADVCSGHRYLNAGLCTATLFAILMFRHFIKDAIFVLASALFFVLVNGVRAAIVMGIASATDMRHFTGHDHVVFGWLLFLSGMVVTYLVGLRLADRAVGHVT